MIMKSCLFEPNANTNSKTGCLFFYALSCYLPSYLPSWLSNCIGHTSHPICVETRWTSRGGLQRFYLFCQPPPGVLVICTCWPQQGAGHKSYVQMHVTSIWGQDVVEGGVSKKTKKKKRQCPTPFPYQEGCRPRFFFFFFPDPPLNHRTLSPGPPF